MPVQYHTQTEEIALIIRRNPLSHQLTFSLTAPEPILPVTGVLQEHIQQWRLTTHTGARIVERDYTSEDAALDHMTQMLADRVRHLAAESKVA